MQVLPDHVYFDITATNLEQTSAVPPIFKFNATRDIPFLLDPQSYYLSIIRFTLETGSLPVFVPSIVPYQSDVNLTIYNITLRCGDIVFTQPIIYSPQIADIPIPPAPSANANKLQNNGNGYYFIYNYQYWVFLINEAFKGAYNGLIALLPAGTTVSDNIPFLSFDTSTKLAYLFADQNGFDILTPPSQTNTLIEIFFNPALFQLYSSFPFRILSSTSQNSPTAVQIAMDTFGAVTNTQSITNSSGSIYTAIVVQQEWSTTALLSPVQAIVFTSSTLPIIGTQVTAPLLYYNSEEVNGSQSSGNTAQIISDFVSDTGTYKPFIVYNPTAQYRYIDCLGNRALSSLDISIFWKDRMGNFVPFRLSSGCSATIKLLFQKKSALLIK